MNRIAPADGDSDSKEKLQTDRSKMDVGVIGPIDGGVKIPGHRPWLIEPFLKRRIESNRLRP